MAADADLLVSRTLDASPTDVFRMWASADERKHWWGPAHFDCTHYEQDFRPGGAWRAMIISDRYGESWMSGVFREVDEEKRIVFTFAWEDGHGKPGAETLVTVSFADESGETLQTFRQTPFKTAADRDSHAEGWNECFDKLAHHIATREKRT